MADNERTKTRPDREDELAALNELLFLAADPKYKLDYRLAYLIGFAVRIAKRELGK